MAVLLMQGLTVASITGAAARTSGTFGTPSSTDSSIPGSPARDRKPHGTGDAIDFLAERRQHAL
jgi:hypothetical protein